jgi:nucleoside-diphosphate-sugar epimerase
VTVDAKAMLNNNHIIGSDDLILVTGATGYIGSKVVETLLELGFRNLRCLSRPSGKQAILSRISNRFPGAQVGVFTGNLLSREDCDAAAKSARVIFHLAAGTGQKSFADAFMNSVVTTRNLLEASTQYGCLTRFVNVSSFAVYSNSEKSRLLDERFGIDQHPELRGEAYCFAKVKQEQLVVEHCRRFEIPYVIVRPGSVYGPGKSYLTDRVGIDTFGIFLHIGGSNTIPLTYVDNCAEAIALAGLKEGIDGEVFNIVDDDLPSSRQFLRLYKRNVRRFRSLYVPPFLSYFLCYLWERYSAYSEGQLPPAFNRKRWAAYWRKTEYSNRKLKTRVGWTQKVPTPEGFKRYFEACRSGETHA